MLGLQNKRSEFFHERTLGVRIAVVRLALTLANFFVIFLDQSLPVDPRQLSALLTFAISTAFLLYAAIALVVVRQTRVAMRLYQVATATGDVLFAALLVLATGGYLSPFNMWFVFAVVVSGFSSQRWLPVLTALMALGAHLLIATVPQERPLEPGIFAVRTGYLYGFAAVVAFIGSYLSRQSQMLVTIEDAGQQLADAREVTEAAQVIADRIQSVLGATFVRVEVDGEEPVEIGPVPAGSELVEVEITPRDEAVGRCFVARSQPLREEELQFLRVLCDRLGSALARIKLGRQLIEAATREERVRLADELHDTYLQTLAAIDMHAEASKLLVPRDEMEVFHELEEIKHLARAGAAQARAFIQEQFDQPQFGPERLQQLLADRWPEKHSLKMEEGIELTAGQWQALEMLLREAMNNARKHSGSSQAAFSMEHSNGHVVVAFEADGESPPKRPVFGYGLSRVQQLVRANGGSMTFRARPGGGVRIAASFPFKHHD
jgi:signal transduction histidine kinase